MRGRPHREVALRTKARLCHAYGIAWADYGTLTLGEQRILLEELEPAPAPVDEPATTPPPPVTTAPPGMERVC
jgi:hypothetical protein